MIRSDRCDVFARWWCGFYTPAAGVMLAFFGNAPAFSSCTYKSISLSSISTPWFSLSVVCIYSTLLDCIIKSNNKIQH